MKDPVSLKLEVSNFSLHVLDFDGDRSREEGNVVWLGGLLVEIGIIFSAIVCFLFFLVRSQALVNVGFGGVVWGWFGGGGGAIVPSSIVLTYSWVCGWRNVVWNKIKKNKNKTSYWVPLKVLSTCCQNMEIWKCLILAGNASQLPFLQLVTYLQHHTWWSYHPAAE